MQPPKKSLEPLARNASVDVLDWQEVDRTEDELRKDILGLSPQDRKALGLSAPQTFDLESPALGGSEVALADVLARGGAMGTPRSTRAGAYVPSSAIGRAAPRRQR